MYIRLNVTLTIRKKSERDGRSQDKFRVELESEPRRFDNALAVTFPIFEHFLVSRYISIAIVKIDLLCLMLKITLILREKFKICDVLCNFLKLSVKIDCECSF